MTFTLYPAIDLKDGACVRLLKGDMDAVTRYNADPADQARRFAEMGFSWIHVVDLNGAFAGQSENSDAVAAILSVAAKSDMQVQLGGGIRSLAQIEQWLHAGVDRLILGTVAVRDPELVRMAAKAFPDKIAIGIDAREGRVAVSGWAEETELGVIELARRFEDCGVSALIVTDIGRDGTKTGVNVELTGGLADSVDIPVIASGGVAGLGDVTALTSWPGRPIGGAILGKALYDGDMDPADALKAAASC